jgi:hypothetical protein
MKRSNGISNNALGGIIALEAIVLGIFIGLKMGFSFEPPSPLSSIVTLGGTRHIVGTIAALIFVPIFAKQIKAGFLAAMVFVTVTLILTLGSIIDLLFITPGYSAKAPVPIAMVLIQGLVLWFSYRAWNETT